MTTNKGVYVNTAVIKSLYEANKVLTPKYIADMALSDFNKHLLLLEDDETSKHSISLHNIFAMSVTLGLSYLSECTEKLESKYLAHDEITELDIKSLKEIGLESIKQLECIDVSELKSK